MARNGAEVRFAPGGDVRDLRGGRWSVEGDVLGVLRGAISDSTLRTREYPDALARVWAALTCPTAGDVLLSCAPNWEFVDWGGVAHVGGGSHGSLHAVDSLGALLWSGVGLDRADAREQWTLRDVTPMIAGHFGAG